MTEHVGTLYCKRPQEYLERHPPTLFSLSLSLVSLFGLVVGDGLEVRTTDRRERESHDRERKETGKKMDKNPHFRGLRDGIQGRKKKEKRSKGYYGQNGCMPGRKKRGEKGEVKYFPEKKKTSRQSEPCQAGAPVGRRNSSNCRNGGGWQVEVKSGRMRMDQQEADHKKGMFLLER